MLTSTLSYRVLAFLLLSASRRLLSGVRRIDCKTYVRKDGTMDGDYIRTWKCRVNRKNTADSVKLEYNATSNKARFGNLMLCGSVWLCSMCSDLIHRGRSDELMRVNQLMEEDHYIVMVTFTMSHGITDTFLESLTALRQAYSKMRSGKSWKNFKRDMGLFSDVTALEVTFGFTNGWHPHLHVLMYFKKSVVDKMAVKDEEIPFADLSGVHALQYRLEEYFGKHWLQKLDNEGASGTLERAIDVQISDRKISEYVTKFGHLPRTWGVEQEMTRRNSKVGKSIDYAKRYSPMELLFENAVNGADWAGDRWLEYALGIQGKRQLRYSKGFKGFLKKNGIDLLTDEQLSETEENLGDYNLLGSLTDDEWQRLLDAGLRGILQDYVEAVQGDGDLVKQFLVDNGVLGVGDALFK